jgi:serine protease Do
MHQRFSKQPRHLKRMAAAAFVVLMALSPMVFSWDGTAGAAAPQAHNAPPVATPPGPGTSFAALAERLSPSVVNIKVSKIEKAALDMPRLPDGPFGEFYKRFFGDMDRLPQNRRVQGAGSGVIIGADGYILTNNHVVEGAQEVMVTLADQRELQAQVVGRDPKTDLAVLKIDAGENLAAAKLGNSDQLKVGDWVLAIGNPFGLSQTVTSGIVSAKGRVIGAGPYDDFIQTDASINPGNSGGPLFNTAGEVVGINTAIVPNGQGIGFAIPINTAKPLIPQLVEHGHVTRGYLGVQIQQISPELAKALQLDDYKGALVASVVPGGPADRGGIASGDVIVAFNNQPVGAAHDLPAMVAATPVGKEATVTVLRNGRKKEIPVKIAELPSKEGSIQSAKKPAEGKWGMQIQDLTPQIAAELGLETDNGGVLVVDVVPGSPAERAAVQRGDLILEADRKPVDSVADLKKIIDGSKDKDTLLLLVQRAESKRYVALTS